jgi:small subunit ribosomal protein S12
LKAFLGGPHKSGVCMKVFFANPKKPNSALRKVVKAKTPENKNVRAHIPGIGHKLMKFSKVLFRGCRVRDLPGMKYRVVRGAKPRKYNLGCVLNRIKGRSKYGTKKTRKFDLKNIDLN